MTNKFIWVDDHILHNLDVRGQLCENSKTQRCWKPWKKGGSKEEYQKAKCLAKHAVYLAKSQAKQEILKDPSPIPHSSIPCGKVASTSQIVVEMLKASGVEEAQQILDQIEDVIHFGKILTK